MLAFAAMLASSILTIDTSFLVLFFIFMLFGVAAFIALEMRRGASGTLTPAFGRQPAEERRLSRALSLAALSVALGSIVLGGALFFVFPRFTALLQPIATSAIFTPGEPISLKGNFWADNSGSSWAASHSYIFRDSTGSLFNPFHNYSPVRYTGFSRFPKLDVAQLRSAGDTYPSDIRGEYLQLPPELDTRIPNLARQITTRANTAYDKARAIEGFLRSRYGYTLNLVGKPGTDPLANFLFVTRAGHCEYFASAMTILLRTLDITAREVNGFLPGEYNDLAGDYIARASDAHSWVEAYFPGSGWVTFDPTPAAVAKSGLLSRLGKYIDWMQLSWNEWVINYDFGHQAQMAQNVQRASRNWTESLRAWFEHAQIYNRRRFETLQLRHGTLGLLLPLRLRHLLTQIREAPLRG